MDKYVEKFLRDWGQGKLRGVKLYNEFSFQFELGEYLRRELGSSYKVQFERNISDFFIDEKSYKNKENLKKDKELIKGPFQKKEIDIVVFKGEDPWNSSEKYAIELKYIMPSDPTSDKMHEMLEDIVFTQQLVDSTYFQRKNEILCDGAIDKSPFNKSYAVVLCDREEFWSGKTTNREKNGSKSRYEIFRTYSKTNQGIDIKLNKTPTSKYLKSTGKEIEVKPFTSKWVDLTNNYKYYIVEA